MAARDIFPFKFKPSAGLGLGIAKVQVKTWRARFFVKSFRNMFPYYFVRFVGWLLFSGLTLSSTGHLQIPVWMKIV